MRVLLLFLFVGVVYSYTTRHPLGGVSYIDQKFYHPQFDSSLSGYRFYETLPGFYNTKNILDAKMFTPAKSIQPAFSSKQLQAYNQFLKDLEDESLKGLSNENFYNPYSFNYFE